MKTITYKALSLLMMLTLVTPFVQAEQDTVSMNPGYITDIYYNMETGVELTSPRELWDLAFATKVFSASILINDGSGAELYTWPNGDTSGWANVDTMGLSTWKPLFNDPEDWEMGAFTRNESGHPDYGWGTYNNITHEIIGDSLYVLKRPDGSTYKVWIKFKTYNNGVPVWIFQLAALDGSGDKTVTIDCTPYTEKNFIYYSIPADQVIDREPNKNDWDILFTKYMAMHPTGSPYIVTGVLSNYDIGVSEVTGVSQLLYNDYAAHSIDSSRSVIGYDWKYFDLGAFMYIVDDSTVFFVHTPDGDIWKIYFTVFEGTTTGNIELMKFKLASSGVEEVMSGEESMFIYPNPANTQSTLLTDLEIGKTANVSILNTHGQVVRAIQIKGSIGSEQTSLQLEGLPKGMYFVQLDDGQSRSTQKLLKQ